jgi:hypothetical protein
MNLEKSRVACQSTIERLEKFYERLRDAPASSSRTEALALIARILNEVEDEMSGIPYNPRVYEDRSAPTDGRMYPPRTYAVALSGCGQFSAGFGEVSC